MMIDQELRQNVIDERSSESGLIRASALRRARLGIARADLSDRRTNARAESFQ
jgi:hypothetical protein